MAGKSSAPWARFKPRPFFVNILTMEFNFSKIKTKSGVPLWVLPMPSSNIVSAGVLIKAGTRDEEWPKEAGIAHALEHMFFQGTEKFPTSKNVSGYIEEVGGNLNAWTLKEMTFYHAHVPSDHKNRAVHIISEQIRKSVFPEEKIAVEMKNIIQEIRRRNDDHQRNVGYLSDQFLYGNHPLSKDTLGIEESVIGFKKENFISFRDRYYNPSNFVFITAGGITAEEALNLFNENFPEEIKLKSNIHKPRPLSYVGDKVNIKKKDIEQIHLILSAATGEAKSKETIYLGIFRDMISGGMSFPLFQEVRDKKGLCYSIWAGLRPWSDVGKFSIYIGTDPKRYKEAITTSLEVVDKSKNDEGLLEKVKQLAIGKLAFKFETSSKIISNAAIDIAFLDFPRGYNEILKDIKETTINDIKQAVDKYLKPEMFYTIILAPKDFIL